MIPKKLSKKFGVNADQRIASELSVSIKVLEELRKSLVVSIANQIDIEHLESLTKQFVGLVENIFKPGSPQANRIEGWQAYLPGPFTQGNVSEAVIEGWYRDGARATISELNGFLAVLKFEESKAISKQEVSANMGQMEGQMRFMVDTVMNQVARVKWNDKKKRFEATANGIKNIGYGPSEKDALAMLRHMVDNNVHERPELENLDEHEAAEASTRKALSSITIHNHHGIVNTGDNSKFENVTVSADFSLKQLNNSSAELAAKLADFLESVKRSEDLSESQKVEVVDCVSEIAIQAAKPEKDRLPHRMINGTKAITECLKGAAALKGVWDAVEPLIKAVAGG